jgi:hypothetical protein
MNKTEEELIWEAYKPSMDDIVEDIITYYNDGVSPEDISEELDFEINEVYRIIKNYKKSQNFIDDSELIDKFKLDPKKHKEGDISIDPEQRSDTVDYSDKSTDPTFSGPRGFVNENPYELGKKSRRETLDKWGKKYNKKK